MKNITIPLRTGNFTGKLLWWIILPAIACLPATLHAQKQGYFTANGKNIGIRTFDKEIEKMIADVGVPAVSLAIIDANKVVYANAYGYKQLSKKDPVDKNTVFEACSLTKSYLVYVVFKLVEEGKLDLDKPMYQYLEPGPFLDHDSRYKLITPRMILCHSSGLENWKEDNNKDTMEILANPGEKFIYSSTGYNWLAAALEKMLGESYHAYITEMELKPLHLDHSYLEFKEEKEGGITKESPSDYATGHDAFGKEVIKWKNREAVPSSANNVTAEDYANLIIAIFDGKHLSANSIKTLVSPGIPTNDHHWPNYYGPGFEVFYSGKDTIIAHGGNNPGFKGQIFYSVVNKRGFVLMTNGDRGKLMTNHLNEMTVGLDINKYYEQFSREPYPSPSIDLFRVYREEGPEAMFAAIDRSKGAGKLGPNTLSELGDVFIEHDLPMTKKLEEMNIALFPGAPLSYVYLGDVYEKMNRYDSAYLAYAKARELQFLWWDLDVRLDLCDKKIKDAQRRRLLVADIREDENSILQAENYNAMSGIELTVTSDSGMVHTVGSIDAGDWMDYKVNIASGGAYIVGFRVSSEKGGGKIELQADTVLLTTVNIAATQGWDKWATVSARVNLPAGIRTLRVYAGAGGFNINWLRFSKAADNVKR